MGGGTSLIAAEGKPEAQQATHLRVRYLLINAVHGPIGFTACCVAKCPHVGWRPARSTIRGARGEHTLRNARFSDHYFSAALEHMQRVQAPVWPAKN